MRYELVDDALTPSTARELARRGATVVWDACGCGAQACSVEWLSQAEVTQLADADLPVVRSRKGGAGSLQHWRSAAGPSLVVAAVDVSWGTAIP